MSLTKFQGSDTISRESINSRLSEADDIFSDINDDISDLSDTVSEFENMFPVIVDLGGTGSTTAATAVSSLKLTDRTEQDFSAASESAYISSAQNYFTNNQAVYVPFTYNAGWAGKGYGVGVGVKSDNVSSDSRTLALFNQKVGCKLYHSNSGAISWTDYSPTGVSLYDNSSGTSSTVALSVSSAKFKMLRIYFKDNGSRYFYTDVYDPSGKSVLLFGDAYSTNIYIKASTITISGASITWTYGGDGQLKNETNSTVTNIQRNSIVSVVGFNRVG